jgi:hypothetical protein
MTESKLSELTDEKLLLEAKKNEIQFNNECRIYWISCWDCNLQSSEKHIWISNPNPLFLTYKLVNKQNHHKQTLENLLKERNLK